MNYFSALYIKKYIVFLFCLFLPSCGKTPEDIITQYHKKGKLNGSILVMQNNQIIYDSVVGYADFSHKRILTKNTPLYIASLSKPFTATAIILLQQKGQLSYDDKASTYLPELPDYAKNISIRHLLSHTSGIRDYENILSGKKGLTNQDVLHWLQEQKGLQFPSGSKFQYSNSGYIILSSIIEKISGESYKSFLEKNIFIPLKMNNTEVYDGSTPTNKNRALGYDSEKKPDDYSILTTGDGGIYSTPEDLYKFDQALRQFSLINKDNTDQMYTPFTLSNGKLSNYGFGWFIDFSGEGKVVSHTGGLDGFRALFWRDIKNNETIITLTNQGDAFPLQNFLDDMRESILKNK
ncbi:serine hydrolase domain-containing protein [Chryseobacterium paridis]|uniref:Beta-lactamase family protein n=1 Tax=Chryseobacterium paridis TaxID=2800328 RepID=A0ABS1FWZ6_9FLAO|nr:serine hydrolase domain-containing protein [Chryseobacterium paridis]MBK1896976.1 beta-lactamase family protein [Chryseobacterium paridis]